MRVSSSNSASATATLLVWLVPLISGISVPTGKLTPITPARPTPHPVNPRALSNPAPVVEYTQENPEPPPLDPSYVPITYNYFNTLAKHHVYYVPLRYRNFNAASNNIDYQPPQKYFGQTLGKNVGYKPYKRLALPYFPVRTVDWNSQYQSTNQYSNQGNGQYNGQVSNQYNNQYNNQNDNQYTNQYNNQYNVQPTTQQQPYEAMSTQSSPASTGSPQPAPTPVPQSDYRKVDYTTGKGSYDVTGKGSYDVTGKGGSKSEYYALTNKGDWSKKSLFPKKVLGQGLTPGKYVSHKY